GGKVGGEIAIPHPGSGVQVSPQQRAVSQFEDTKVFGPANSFSFTINQGSLLGPPLDTPAGEWHMHCHVLNHMHHDGMMGSLLLIDDRKPVPVSAYFQNDHIATKTVYMRKNRYHVDGKDITSLTLEAGDSLVWINEDPRAHTATSEEKSDFQFDTG